MVVEMEKKFLAGAVIGGLPNYCIRHCNIFCCQKLVNVIDSFLTRKINRNTDFERLMGRRIEKSRSRKALGSSQTGGRDHHNRGIFSKNTTGEGG
jgi:hypothetical protein